MTQSYIGAPIMREEDVRFLTGRANFLDDITRPGMLHAALLRSPHAHALITRTETAEASAMPGVWAVFTYDDIASLAKAIPIRVFELPGLDRFLQYLFAISHGYLIRYTAFTLDHLYWRQLVKLLDHQEHRYSTLLLRFDLLFALPCHVPQARADGVMLTVS